MNLVTWYRPTLPIVEEIASLSGILVSARMSSPCALHTVWLSDAQTLPLPVVSSASPALNCYQSAEWSACHTHLGNILVLSSLLEAEWTTEQ